ncbi:pyrroloquinoline quinone biosynthesis protein C [Azoarcus sp. CIB]|uniref:pyrroloquinoline-quinone synthase PqqC n=1 Tax=Aromatoleum sp. (strain CIB) TaxID=198107 RepID=UPI0006A266A8|nr:pyrroloquinoline-quinone synthase PqqC [Azoarcus sp. CIB]AKU11176.1 pyrroloquinoline quinone biosynthesis protein C [Azoarcus sp. CIB]
MDFDVAIEDAAARTLQACPGDAPPLSREEFEARLRGKSSSYHIHHPFHVMMAEGKLTRAQLQGWVANRFYYQIAIPVKDAAIMSNCPDREIRREWIQRILDHDGYAQLGEGGGVKDPGGIEAWIRLGEAVGLTRDDVTSLRFVVPAARFAVDAYVNFARQRPWQEAIASSLTELFAPHIHQQRIDTWPQKYPWVDVEGLQYFRNRLTQARRDVAHGLRFTLDYFSRSRALQERALEILQFKLDVLWALADAIMLSQCEIEIRGEKAGARA